MLDDLDLLFCKAEVTILLEKGDSPVMSVVRDHDSEWHVEVSRQGRILLASSCLTGKRILCVVLEV